ncbi:AzlC family ABC transporter permease [Arthrobacter dokdonensis]|uniref:AzlC family ABC transporter permease n=1 Tax=Arthrobacter dokdonellae TaxID=2211210 RepID=UPI001013CAF6|nr:AzlC family ABC transporter permease [Arthrobacter dokdonellae]
MTLRESPAARIGASIAIATGLYGVSFGALSVASGLNFWQTIALSLLLFSGGSQFAFIGVIAGGGTGVAAMSASALLGIRNGVYGMQLNALLRPTGWRRFAAAHVTIDESTATATGQIDPSEQKRGFWVAGLGIYLLWNAFTAAGAFLGDALGDPRQWGLDGAAVAAFLGLLWPRIRAVQPAAIAAVCAVVTLLAVPLVAPGVPILVAAVVAGLIGWFRHGATPAHAPGHVGDGLEPDIEPYRHEGGTPRPARPGPESAGRDRVGSDLPGQARPGQDALGQDALRDGEAP